MAQLPSPQELQARRRAALIVQVQCGQITATEAANQMGVSRKTYYEWEKRALQALIQSQQDRPGGWPAMPHDAEKEKLQQQAQQLQEQARVLEQTLAIREQLAALSRSRTTPEAVTTIVNQLQTLHEQVAEPYRPLCQVSAVPYSTFMRWHGRGARGEPVWQQPGPKPVGELDLAENITAGDGSTVLGTYTTARWYHVEIGYERIGTDLRLTYWMDGSSVGQATTSVGDLAVELSLDHVELDAQEGSAWFDNLRVYTFAAVLPIPVTLPATIITAGNAILNGDVNPNGLSATTCFEWGATTGYGAWTATQPAGQGTTNVAVWSLLGTLSPSTSNHYRLMTSNSVGVCYGEDRAFTTLSLYEAWRQSQFTAAELSDAAISGDTANPDGDGKTNWHEFLAGTTPKDGSSAMRITGMVSPSAGTFTVTWSSVPGKTYKVLYADGPGGPWQEDLPASERTDGTGETSLSYTDETVGTATKRFYRIKLIVP